MREISQSGPGDPTAMAEALAEARSAGQPMVLRGLVRDWPAVEAARAGSRSLAAYLAERAGPVPVRTIEGDAAIEGRFHYTDDLSGLNFARAEMGLPAFLDRLMAEAEADRPNAFAAQGVGIREAMPAFEAENPLPLLPPSVAPRAWIGNSARVATHHDPQENLACVVAGRRRFTLFPPDQVANLYMGPFHFTPAGVAISMVHVTAPDLDRFPRFREALDHGQAAELDPGDAIYIPYQWYHHVEASGPLTMLVNYWWNDAGQAGGSPWDAMLHGMMTLRSLPGHQRQAWREMFDHYVFLSNEDPGAHLPVAMRGILAQTGEAQLRDMRRLLIEQLSRPGRPRRG